MQTNIIDRQTDRRDRRLYAYAVEVGQIMNKHPSLFYPNFTPSPYNTFSIGKSQQRS